MHYEFHITSCSFLLSFRTALKSHNPLELLYYSAHPSLSVSLSVSLSYCLNQVVSCAHTQAQLFRIHAHEIHIHVHPHKQTHTLAHVEKGFQDLPELSYKYARRISNQDNVDQPGFSGNVCQNEFRFLPKSDTVYSWF